MKTFKEFAKVVIAENPVIAGMAAKAAQEKLKKKKQKMKKPSHPGYGTEESVEEGTVLDIKDADKWGKEIQNGIDAPWANVEKSTLGGDENVALMIKISLDPKEDWNNKIYQNSRFAMIRLGANGEMEMFASHRHLKNMRKTKFKTAKDAVGKINTWIKKVS